MKNKRKKTLSFDLWLTLIYESDLSANSEIRRDIRSKKIQKKLSKNNIDVSIEKISSCFNKISDSITEGHEKGFDRKFIQWVSKGVNNLVVDTDKVTDKLVKNIAAVIDDAFLEHPPQLLDGVLDMLSLLKERYKIIMISNTGLTSPEAYIEWFKRINLYDKFDEFFFSNELSLAKPSEKLFKMAFNSINSLPEDVLHIGDNPNTDICGAKNVGAHTVLISNGITYQFSCKPDFFVDSVIDVEQIVKEWDM
ncbi:MAG: HAD family hydrolase [Dehalococcoidia bacterium]